jgi:soluble lytic murein transglycosylase-like protein
MSFPVSALSFSVGPKVEAASVTVSSASEVQSPIEETSTPEVKPIAQTSPPTQEEIINGYVHTICAQYNVDPELVESIIYFKSRYQPNEKTGDCLGLMQVSKRWHMDRAERLGVTDFYDPYSNILLGVDYLSELFNTYHDPALVLMLYNMNHNTAFALYKQGKVSDYARSVLTRMNELKAGGDLTNGQS